MDWTFSPVAGVTAWTRETVETALGIYPHFAFAKEQTRLQPDTLSSMVDVLTNRASTASPVSVQLSSTSSTSSSSSSPLSSLLSATASSASSKAFLASASALHASSLALLAFSKASCEVTMRRISSSMRLRRFSRRARTTPLFLRRCPCSRLPLPTATRTPAWTPTQTRSVAYMAKRLQIQ